MRKKLLITRMSHAALSFLIIIAILGADSCRTVTEPPRTLPQRVAKLDVLGTDGSQHERSVGVIASGDARKTLLQHHLQYMAPHAGPPLIAGNEVKLLIDGPQTYDAIFSSLAVAKHTIDVEVYIFDDSHIGQSLADLLKQKQRSGVRVRVIYDAVGSIKTSRSLFDAMRDAGVQVIEFNPVNSEKIVDLNNRDHRKITIVDNNVAYTGGINISSVYAHGSGLFGRSKRKAEEESAMKDGWRDTQIEVRGPAVQALSDLFEAVWRSNGGAVDSLSVKVDPPAAQGDKYVRVIGSSPEDKVNIIYSDLLNAVEHAERSIHITMSYFSPNTAMIEALCNAARRGVEVELVLPGFSDWWPVLEAGRSHYTTLIDAGVAIYERKDVFLHAKTAVIDGVWSTVGSSNMDMRSFLHNNEVNTVVLGNEFGKAMESMFSIDREHAESIDRETWQQRSLSLRIKQSIARAFAYWL